MGRDPMTILDWSAAVTGMILAFNLPVSIPYWMAIVGCFVAIVIVKQLFGGLGQNFANPAIVGRIALFIGFAGQMSNWTVTSKMSPVITGAAGVDAVAGPTPLGLYTQGAEVPEFIDMFLGKINGSMGEISSVLLIVGGLYLMFKHVISPAIPVSYLATVAVLSLCFGRNPLFDLCSLRRPL